MKDPKGGGLLSSSRKPKDSTLNTAKRISIFFIALSILHISAFEALAELKSRAAILMNMSNGRILYKHNPYDLIPPASLTKVLSMYVAMDLIKAKKLSLTKKTKISTSAIKTGGSKMHLRRGETVTIKQLLLGMAVSSGNNASTALAQAVAKSNDSFVKMMNAKAKKIGMKNSTFKTPHGLPATGQLTTAYDMLKMARSYISAHPKAMSFHNTRSFKHNKVLHKSTNKLLGRVPGVYGLKTGYTNASGFNLIFTAKRGNVELLGVIMGGPTRAIRDAEATKILEAGFASPNSSTKVARTLSKKSYNASNNKK